MLFFSLDIRMWNIQIHVLHRHCHCSLQFGYLSLNVLISTINNTNRAGVRHCECHNYMEGPEKFCYYR
jgi:hypothetical protein